MFKNLLSRAIELCATWCNILWNVSVFICVCSYLSTWTFIRILSCIVNQCNFIWVPFHVILESVVASIAIRLFDNYCLLCNNYPVKNDPLCTRHGHNVGYLHDHITFDYLFDDGIHSLKIWEWMLLNINSRPVRWDNTIN